MGVWCLIWSRCLVRINIAQSDNICFRQHNYPFYLKSHFILMNALQIAEEKMTEGECTPFGCVGSPFFKALVLLSCSHEEQASEDVASGCGAGTTRQVCGGKQVGHLCPEGVIPLGDHAPRDRHCVTRFVSLSPHALALSLTRARLGCWPASGPTTGTTERKSQQIRTRAKCEVQTQPPTIILARQGRPHGSSSTPPPLPPLLPYFYTQQKTI